MLHHVTSKGRVYVLYSANCADFFFLADKCETSVESMIPSGIQLSKAPVNRRNSCFEILNRKDNTVGAITTHIEKNLP